MPRAPLTALPSTPLMQSIKLANDTTVVGIKPKGDEPIGNRSVYCLTGASKTTWHWTTAFTSIYPSFLDFSTIRNTGIKLLCYVIRVCKGWFYFYSTIGYVSIAFVQNIVPNVALDIVGKKGGIFQGASSPYHLKQTEEYERCIGATVAHTQTPVPVLLLLFPSSGT